MIQIIPISQYSNDEPIATLPPELFPYTAGFSYKLLQLIAAIYAKDPSFQSFPVSEEGLFIVQKNKQIIGFGSVITSPNMPPTAGIAVLNNCFLIPTERQKGYGTQLFKHLRQYAALHFGLLQLNKDCPLWNQVDGGYIDLE